jgi:hypothetical protein
VFVRNFVALGFILFGFAVAELALAQQQAAQQPTVANRPYDGIQAGLDAFRLGEEQRQANVSQQLFLNDQMRFWNGYPTSGANAIYYGYLSPGAMLTYGYGAPVMTRANLDFVYGYGVNPAWSGWRQGATGPLSVFEPWPYVAGDIWGYRAYYQPARQPVGQVQTQTGPNRWESHPIYNPPLTAYQPLPPVNSPLLDRTPYAVANGSPAGGEAIPQEPPAAMPPVRRGPREY